VHVVILSAKVLTIITIFFLGDESSSSEVHLGRMLQILREFSTDPILSVYVIDDVWEYMKAMKVYCYDILNCRLHRRTRW
jgi:hypothetical protein